MFGSDPRQQEPESIKQAQERKDEVKERESLTQLRITAGKFCPRVLGGGLVRVGLAKAHLQPGDAPNGFFLGALFGLSKALFQLRSEIRVGDFDQRFGAASKVFTLHTGRTIFSHNIIRTETGRRHDRSGC